MEVCVDSVESAINAEMAGKCFGSITNDQKKVSQICFDRSHILHKFSGAKRVELCSNLMEGGTTPSIGTLQANPNLFTCLPFGHTELTDFLSEAEILSTVLDKWTEALDSGHSIDCIYMDYAKAFDTVPH